MKHIFDILKKGLPVVAIALSLALGMTACDDDLLKFKDDAKGAYAPTTGDPIATTLTNSGEFTEWLRLLEYTGTYSVLNALYDGSNVANKFTLFVPTDEAMQRFYASKGVTCAEELDRTYATYVVRSMVTKRDSLKLSEKFSASEIFSCVNAYSYLLSFTPDTTQSCTEFESGYLLGDSIHISRAYTACSNGFYYVADGVISPLVATAYDRIASTGQSTIMTAALQATGYDRLLSHVSDTTIVLGLQAVKYYYFTFLNVQDECFAFNGIRSLSDLQDSLMARSRHPEVGADSLLREYVAYHLFRTVYTKSELAEMLTPNDTVRIWNPSATNQIIMSYRHVWHITDTLTKVVNGKEVQYVDTLSMLSFNDEDTSYEKPLVSASDETYGISSDPVRRTCLMGTSVARNGYVHELSDWLPVYEPQATAVVWDLADYPEVRNRVGSHPDDVSASERKVSLEKLSCYEVEEGPQGGACTVYSNLISYVTCKKNLKDCINFDRVVINVGYQGSVAMKSPTIVKGRYRVSLRMAYITDQKFIRISNGCKGGLLRLSVDGENQILTSPYTSITSSENGVYEADLYSEIEFTETNTHTFKFVVMDPAASTNTKFYLQFDAITFTPID